MPAGPFNSRVLMVSKDGKEERWFHPIDAQEQKQFGWKVKNPPKDGEEPEAKEEPKAEENVAGEASIAVPEAKKPATNSSKSSSSAKTGASSKS